MKRQSLKEEWTTMMKIGFLRQENMWRGAQKVYKGMDCAQEDNITAFRSTYWHAIASGYKHNETGMGIVRSTQHT